MSKNQKKYYVVWAGNQTGILDTWEECKNSIHGFKGAKYKSYTTFKLAQKALSESYDAYKSKTKTERTLSKEQVELISKPILDSVSVDAACSGNPGIVEYQCIDNSSHNQLFYFGPLNETTNNVGEFLALVHALAYMKSINDERPIYSDSKIAIGWVKKKICNTKLVRTDENSKSFELVERAIMWLRNNDYRNDILKWETRAWGEIPADFGRK